MAIRLPSSVLAARGAFAKNPNRERIDPIAPGEDLGDPPPHFCAPEIEIWNELRASCPWAHSADRFLAEVASSLMYRFRQGECKTAEVTAMLNALKMLGATPTTRSMCATKPEKKSTDNVFAEFADGGIPEFRAES